MKFFIQATKEERNEIMQNASRQGCNSSNNGKYMHGSVIMFERKQSGIIVSSNALSQKGRIMDYLPQEYRGRAEEMGQPQEEASYE